MEVKELLVRLTEHGVSVSIDDDHLRLVPGSRVRSDLAETVREHKPELMEYLKARGADGYLAEAPIPAAQIEMAETVNDKLGITDLDHRRYNVLSWARGYYQDRYENHGEQYDALKREQMRLSRILDEKGIG